MIRDRPDGADLLAQARRTMSENLLGDLSGKARYQALMVLRAMALAEMELRGDKGLERQIGDQLRLLLGSDGAMAEPELFSLLSGRIRAGQFDASGELYDALRLLSAFKLQRTGPTAGDGKPPTK